MPGNMPKIVYAAETMYGKHQMKAEKIYIVPIYIYMCIQGLDWLYIAHIYNQSKYIYT